MQDIAEIFVLMFKKRASEGLGDSHVEEDGLAIIDFPTPHLTVSLGHMMSNLFSSL